MTIALLIYCDDDVSTRYFLFSLFSFYEHFEIWVWSSFITKFFIINKSDFAQSYSNTMIERSAAECMVMEVDAPYSSAGEGGAVIRVPRGASLPELTSIQLPCMVRTHAQALDVIEGGKQTIDACMTGGMASGLHHQIYASLDGPAAAAVADGPRCLLTGTPRPAQGLLVKLVRRRTRGADGAVVRESVTTEVLGKVTKEYQFSTPFDFQVYYLHVVKRRRMYVLAIHVL